MNESVAANRDVAVVIPALNEVEVIGETVASVADRFGVVVLVDDGSRDGTGEAARKSGATVVRHPINLGQGAALSTGIMAALRLPQIQYIVTFDADGQHRAEDAQALVERAREGDVDIVLGTRFGGERIEAGRAKKALLKAALLYTRVDTGLPLTDTHNGLRAMTRSFATDLELEDPGMGHASDILNHIANTSAKWVEVPVVVRYTDYSRGKGQPLINSVNILFDRLLR